MTAHRFFHEVTTIQQYYFTKPKCLSLHHIFYWPFLINATFKINVVQHTVGNNKICYLEFV